MNSLLIVTQRGYAEMVESLPTVDAAAETAGVAPRRVRDIASTLTVNTLIYWGMGVNQSIQGTGTARAVIDLCLATGNVGPGSGPFSLTGQANSMGNRVCASKGTWPGHRAFGDSANRKIIADTWDVPFSRLPKSPGPGFIRIIDELARGNIDICWTVATNPVAGVPDSSRVETALEDTFLITQDTFRSDTINCADVVLPAATWGESTGTVMNMERRISRVTASADPPAKVRQDIDIIAAVGNRIHAGLFNSPPLDPKSVFDEIRELTAGTNADMFGITYDRLESERAVRWPAPSADTEGGYRYHDDGEWSFQTASGQARFSTETHTQVPEPVDSGYPLTLTTGRTDGVYNTGVRTRDDTDTERPTARIHPETIVQYLDSFERGQTVITSRRSQVIVDVSPNDDIPPGMVWLPIHNAIINELTLSAVDPYSAEPNLKQCAVALLAPARQNMDTPHGAVSK